MNANTLREAEQRMIEKLPSMTKSDAQVLLANARKHRALDLEAACIRRIADLAAPADKSPFVRGFWRNDSAAKEAGGFHNRRLGQMLFHRAQLPEQEALREIVIACVSRKEPSDGFKDLRRRGLIDLTYENLVLDFAEDFPPDVVAIARQRLAQ
jgi:hypothetical protein